MSNNISFDIDETFWEAVVDQLEQSTDYDRSEIERGLAFMSGRRVRNMLETMEGEQSNLLEELDVAITHSRDEK